MGFPSLASQVPKRDVRFANFNRDFRLIHMKKRFPFAILRGE
jgi:hypothetical protein